MADREHKGRTRHVHVTEDKEVMASSVLRSGDNFMALWATVTDEFKGGIKNVTGLEQLADTSDAF